MLPQSSVGSLDFGSQGKLSTFPHAITFYIGDIANPHSNIHFNCIQYSPFQC